jgi:aryl-alcohol dehydrogenase-like predicted oxidoreductase
MKKESSVQLVLGTVQFGLAYGVAGRGSVVPHQEARAILARAWELGVRLLDTAPGYGDIEEHLAELTRNYSFSLVSKVPALPRDANADEIAEFVTDSIHRSHKRLGARLQTILFHRGDDLLEMHGQSAWDAASKICDQANVGLGASFYCPAAAVAAKARFPLAAVQVPGNVFDQRLLDSAVSSGLRGVEVHLRSVFLQGLLFLPRELAAARIPKAARALTAWEQWCAARNVTPLRSALGFAKSLPGVRYCIVGVDRLEQLEQIATAWEECSPVSLAALASTDEAVIDPRRWNAA